MGIKYREDDIKDMLHITHEASETLPKVYFFLDMYLMYFLCVSYDNNFGDMQYDDKRVC